MTEREIRKLVHKLGVELSQARHELYSAGLFATGHALHDAIRKLGWEAADVLIKAQMLEAKTKLLKGNRK